MASDQQVGTWLAQLLQFYEQTPLARSTLCYLGWARFPVPWRTPIVVLNPGNVESSRGRR